MECYRFNCKETCDKFKQQYCIMRLTKEQYDLIASIKGKGHCRKCGRETVNANYKNEIIELCTECGVRNLQRINMYA